MPQIRMLLMILFIIPFNESCRSDDQLTVVESYYFEDGSLRLEKFKDKNFSGYCHQSYYLNGKKELYFCTDSLGKKVGPNIMYYENGQLKDEQYYENGLLEGASNQYYSNGKIKSVYHYSNGNLNGVNRTFYESGELKSKMIHIEDQKIFQMSYDLLDGDSSLFIKPYVAAPDTVYLDDKFDVRFDLPIFSEIEFNIDTQKLVIYFDMIPWGTTNDGTEFSKPRFQEEIDSLPFTIEVTAVKKGDFVIYGHLSNSSGWKQKDIQSTTFIKRYTAIKKTGSSTI